MFYRYNVSDVRVLKDVNIKSLSINYVLCFHFLYQTSLGMSTIHEFAMKISPMKMLLLLPLVASDPSNSTLTVTMFSDAQCPCSAQVLACSWTILLHRYSFHDS